MIKLQGDNIIMKSGARIWFGEIILIQPAGWPNE